MRKLVHRLRPDIVHGHGAKGGLLARMTKGITLRYIAMEAAGLKARAENPHYRHTGAA